MKLLNCMRCHDILSLTDGKLRTCRCGQSEGRYINELEVLYKGQCRILGIANSEYTSSLKALTTLDEKGNSVPTFKWFVILEGRNIRKIG